MWPIVPLCHLRGEGRQPNTRPPPHHNPVRCVVNPSRAAKLATHITSRTCGSTTMAQLMFSASILRCVQCWGRCQNPLPKALSLPPERWGVCWLMPCARDVKSQSVYLMPPACKCAWRQSWLMLACFKNTLFQFFFTTPAS